MCVCRGALTFDNYDCGRQSLCQWGFPWHTFPYDRQSCVLFVVGRQAVNVSSCTNNNVYLTKANGMQRGQKKRPCCTWTHLPLTHRSGIPTNADWGHISQPQQRQSQERHRVEAVSLYAIRQTQRRASVKVKRSFDRKRM